MPSAEAVCLAVEGPLAIITLNKPERANALTSTEYALLGDLLREADKLEEVLITIVTGAGTFFSAGASLDQLASGPGDLSIRRAYQRDWVPGAMDTSRALYTHSKILVAAVNGPAVGIAAAFLGWFDLIYLQTGAYLLTPFTSLGLLAEGGSSRTFAQRLGYANAREALLFGTRLTADKLLACGFASEVLPKSPDFLQTVKKRLLGKIANVDPTALLAMKAMLKGKTWTSDTDAANLDEIMAAIRCMESGVPQKKVQDLQKRKSSKL